MTETTLTAALAAMTAERDDWKAKYTRQALHALRMIRVVSAAKEWRHRSSGSILGSHERPLAAAVDALDGVSPEGTARPPGSTQAAPQAPDVAQGTDGLEAHRGAERAQGGIVAPGQIYLVGEVSDGE